MVFVLDDIVKIETTRITDICIVENFAYVQPSNSVIRDPRTFDKIEAIMEEYVHSAQFYVWSQDAGSVFVVFRDAFLNAGQWGNKDEAGKRIQVCIKYGLFGSVIYVEDEGDGFDFMTQIEKLQRGCSKIS